MVVILVSVLIFGLQQRFGDNMEQLLDPNHASLLKSAAAAGQSSGYVITIVLIGCVILLKPVVVWEKSENKERLLLLY